MMSKPSSMKDFDIIAQLGKGSFSSVYKVRRIDDKTLYAMKKVKIGQMSSKEKQNSLNEVRILASLDHPNIIHYKEAFFDDRQQTLCVVMEIAEEGDLLKKTQYHIKNKSYFTENEIWKALIHMTKGLKALHDMDILHRDLKCANVFCAADGTLKLGDLNVSKVTKKVMARTQTGTPYYTSPEVWKERPYDSKCDIWSLGCVIYEMASLRPPFRANTLKELYNKIQKGLFDRLPVFYSDQLQNMVNDLLKVNPGGRPSAKQILSHKSTAKYMMPGDFHQPLLPKLSLLKTIMVPKNLKSLKQLLPGAQYNNGSRSSRSRQNSMVRANSVNSISRVSDTPKIYNRKQYIRPNSERRYSKPNQQIRPQSPSPSPYYLQINRGIRPSSKNMYRNPSVDALRQRNRQKNRSDSSNLINDARSKSKQIKDRLNKLINQRNQQLKRNQSQIARNVAKALEAVKKIPQSPSRYQMIPKPRSASYQNNKYRSPAPVSKVDKYNPKNYAPPRRNMKI